MICLWTSRKQVRLWEVMLALALWGLASKSIRMIPIFAFGTLPILLRAVPAIPRPAWTQRPAFISTLIVLFSGLVFGVYSNRLYAFQRLSERFSLGVSPIQFPHGAVDFIKEQGLGAKGFNTVGWGGFLLWSLPEHPVFIDGHAEVYGEEFMRSYWNAMSDTVRWKAMVDHFQFKTILLPAGVPISLMAFRETANDPRYALVYLDQSAILFARRDALTPLFLEQYEIHHGRQAGKEFQPKTVSISLLPLQVHYPSGLLQLGSSLFQLKQSEKALIYFELAEKQYPDLDAEIYHNIGSAHLFAGRWQRAAEYLGKSIERQPQNTETYYALGVAEFKGGDFQAAKRAWEQVLDFQPNHSNALKRDLKLSRADKSAICLFCPCFCYN